MASSQNFKRHLSTESLPNLPTGLREAVIDMVGPAVIYERRRHRAIFTVATSTMKPQKVIESVGSHLAEILVNMVCTTIHQATGWTALKAIKSAKGW
jgi:hypothetical protein